jgi:hypothetical protein
MVATVREGIHDDNGQEKGTPERHGGAVLVIDVIYHGDVDG